MNCSIGQSWYRVRIPSKMTVRTKTRSNMLITLLDLYLQRGKAAFPPPCFLENRGLEGVWALPWGILEGSGRLLGGSWLQEASWVFCRLLSGGSWAAQEPSWGPRWTQVEGQDGSKILPRRPKMSLRCLQDCPRSDFQSKSKEKWILRVRMVFSIRF